MSVENENQGKQKRQAIIIIVVLALIVVAAFVGYRLVSTNTASQSAGYELTESNADFPKAADVAACEVETRANGSKKLGEVLEGKPAIINFWATWCPHCVSEMGDYQRLYDEYADRVQFIMVDVTQGDMQEYFSARDFMDENGYSMPLYFDTTNDLVTLFAIRGLPTSVILSDDGQVLMCRAGEIEYNSMKATIESLLKA